MGSGPVQRKAHSHADKYSTVLKNILPGRLLLLRRIHSLSQKQAARRLGIAVSTLNAIEGGQANDLKFSTLCKMSECFRVSIDYLLGLERQQDLVRGFYDQGVFRYYTIEIFEDGNSPRKCFYCGWPLNPHRSHSIPECMLMMHQRNQDYQFIANRFGFSVKGVQTIIEEEIGILRS